MSVTRKIQHFHRVVFEVPTPTNGNFLDQAITAAERDLEERGIEYYPEVLSVTLDGAKIIISYALPMTEEVA